jgi:hypothetical protein
MVKIPAPNLENLAEHPIVDASVGAYYSSEFKNYELLRVWGQGRAGRAVGQMSVEMFDDILPKVFQNVVMVDDLSSPVSENESIIAIIEPSIEYYDFWILGEKDPENKGITYRLTVRNMETVPVSSWTVTGGYRKPPKGNKTPITTLAMEEAAEKMLEGLSARFRDEDFLALLQTDSPAGSGILQEAAGEEPPVSVTARNMVGMEEQEQQLGFQIKRTNLAAIFVAVENQQVEKPFLIRPSDMTLELADGKQCIPECTARMASSMEGTGKGLALTLLINPIAGAMPNQGNIKNRAENLEKMELRKLQETTLAKGDSAQGFLYFILPEKDTSLDGARLSLWLIDESAGDGIKISAPVSGAGEVEQQ